jgi:hypothetical protein
MACPRPPAPSQFFFLPEEQSMERKRVNSSKIRAVGYDPKSRVLEVELRDGTVLAYSDAPSPTSYYEDKIVDEFSARRL